MKSFTDPGSGLRMQAGKWYVLGDSGFYYTDRGFDSIDAAQQWWKDEGFEEHRYSDDRFKIADVPVYNPESVGFDNVEAVNIFYADDLYDFAVRDEIWTGIVIDLEVEE